MAPDGLYRPCLYTLEHSEGGEHLLVSLLTGAKALLDDGEWAAIENAARRPVSGRQLEEAGLGDLARTRLFVTRDTDDYGLCELAVNVRRTMERPDPGVKEYTILPTTACNARCTYCYEAGMSVRTMTRATADRVIDFIDRTRRDGEITLIWFGGEPLAAAGVISHVCRGLNERGIAFRSKIITNGTLLTPELAEEARETWRLKMAQVSVDGVRADYEARKRYIDPAAHNYETMLRAVELLLSRDVQVALRCNYDADNLERVRDFLAEIRGRFGQNKNLTAYASMLFQAQGAPGCEELHRQMTAIQEDAPDVCRRNREKDPFALRINHCMADSGGRSVVIDPDGLLYRCEHLPDNVSFGSVDDEAVVLGSDPRASEPPREECRVCPFLPKCTPFYRNGCPDWFAACRQFKEIDARAAMKRLLRRRREEEN